MAHAEKMPWALTESSTKGQTKEGQGCRSPTEKKELKSSEWKSFELPTYEETGEYKKRPLWTQRGEQEGPVNHEEAEPFVMQRERGSVG